jgi:hypothetical protein
MDHDLGAPEMARPVCPRADVPDRSNLGARYRFWRPTGYAKNIVAARGKATAQRITDEARRTGHQNARQTRSSSLILPRMARAIPAQMH